MKNISEGQQQQQPNPSYLLYPAHGKKDDNNWRTMSMINAFGKQHVAKNGDKLVVSSN